MPRLFAALLFLLATSVVGAADLPLDRIRLPAGFAIEVYARVPGARSLALGDKGTVFVGTMNAGRVYALRPAASGRTADVSVVASGLNTPNGVAFRQGALYVAEIDRILRFDDIEGRLDAPPRPVVVTDRFPSDRHHGWKRIAFGPDGLLYVPVGAPCNVCEPDPDRATRCSRGASAIRSASTGTR